MNNYIKSTEEIYASSMSRLLSHLDTENVATITAFVTSDDSRRSERPNKPSNKANKRANADLSNDLRGLKYGFTKVDGYYREEGLDEPILERSYYVICPKSIGYEKFAKSLIALARKYEQQSVLVWSYENQKATLYMTEDYSTYKAVETFNSFNVDGAKDEAWSEFRTHSISFSNVNEEDVEAEYVVESATELEGGYIGNWMTMMGFQSNFNNLISKYGDEMDCIDDDNEIIFV